MELIAIRSDPYFYIPLAAFTKDVELEKITQKEGFCIARLSAGGKSTERVLVFNPPKGELSNLVRIEVSALGLSLPSLIPSHPLSSPPSQSNPRPDAWFVEDEKLLGPHPKDPYKRVETIPSSREIRIEVNGTVLAQSTQNIFLFETMLRTRFYLDPINLDWGSLRESETTSFCPYKGMAK